MQKRTYTVEEAGEILGIGRSAAYQGVRTGEIPAIRIGKRWIVLRQVLEQRLSTAKPSTPEMQISAELILALEQLLSTAKPSTPEMKISAELIQALEQLLSSAKPSTPENRIDTDAVR